MSSPAASTTSNDGSKPKQLEQITFRFCSECSNMLYPKEDEDNHKLQFTCRTCQYTEEATSTCIYRNVLNNAAGETAGVTQDVSSDPTVGDCSVHSHLLNTSTAMIPVFCFCCGKIIMCEVCDSHPAAFPANDDDITAAVAEVEVEDEDPRRRSTGSPVSVTSLDELFTNMGCYDIDVDSMTDEYAGEGENRSDLAEDAMLGVF
jgi:DNA-directed RNA polymerase II subunit RPB9